MPPTDTDGCFSVTWTASATFGVTYKLEQSVNGGDFAQVYSGTALSYAVTGLTNGNYQFRVKATKSSYVDSSYVIAACEVTLTLVDAPSTINVPTLDQDGAFTVTWPASLLSGVTYKLERADNGGAFVQVYSGTALSYAVSGLTDGSYQFRVKAIKTGYLEVSTPPQRPAR